MLKTIVGWGLQSIENISVKSVRSKIFGKIGVGLNDRLYIKNNFTF